MAGAPKAEGEGMEEGEGEDEGEGQGKRLLQVSAAREGELGVGGFSLPAPAAGMLARALSSPCPPACLAADT